MDELPAEIGQLQAGMTREQVASSLSQPELTNDLFVFDGNQLVDDMLVRSCQQGDREAPLLLWIALLLADTRLQEIVTHDMTLPSGRLDPSKFSGDAVRKIADARVGG